MKSRLNVVGSEVIYAAGAVVAGLSLFVLHLLRLCWKILPALLLLYGFVQFLGRNPQIRDWLFLHFGQGGTAAIVIAGLMLCVRRLMRSRS